MLGLSREGDIPGETVPVIALGAEPMIVAIDVRGCGIRLGDGFATQLAMLVIPFAVTNAKVFGAVHQRCFNRLPPSNSSQTKISRGPGVKSAGLPLARQTPPDLVGRPGDTDPGEN